MKVAFFDFEFRATQEKALDLVSVYVETTVDKKPDRAGGFWLFKNPKAQARAKAFFLEMIAQGYLFVAYAAEAEARSLLTLLGEDAHKLEQARWIDLYLEYRCLLNHNHRLAYGKQLVDGRVITTKPPPPKWARHEGMDQDDDYHKPSYSLASATFKILGLLIDSAEKDAVRDIIIHGDNAEVFASRNRIMAYNKSDVTNLAPLQRRMLGHFVTGGVLVERWLEAALKRGEYAYRTARMVELGYPVNVAKIKKLTANIGPILTTAAEDCIRALPDSFVLDKKTRLYRQSMKSIRAWIKEQKLPHWRLTDTKELSVSRDAFKDWYDSSSPGFAGAFCRFLKTKQSLNGFLPGGKKGAFLDHVGSDARCRPYFGIFGAQSSRSQPGATGFLPLKAAWMRSFIEPLPGRAIVGVDYSSQEFLIAAILSQDKAMMRAYESGDVYLAFGKEAKLIPKDGTKATHKKLRDVCKALVLGISYDMTAKGLAPRLSAASGEQYTEVEAQRLISLFYDIYCDYDEWKREVIREYEQEGKLTLPDGWVMWGNNDNTRSVGNCPVQGHGAVIMREAVAIAQDVGLDVIFTLHDAIYAEYESKDLVAIRTLMRAMQDAFRKVMSPYGATVPIRLEGFAWSPDYRAAKPTLPGVDFATEYVDEKGKEDYERYRKFFDS